MYQLVDATLAFLELGNTELAGELADRTLKQAAQVRSVRRLQDWISLLHKAIRISEELSFPTFARNLFSAIEGWYFFSYVLGFERRPILVAYTYHLLSSLKLDGFDEIRRGVMSRHERILNDVRNERRTVLRCLGLMLAHASQEEIVSTAKEARWNRLWERGLAAVLWELLFTDTTNPFVPSDFLTSEQWESVLAVELNEDVGNLEFALVFHLAGMGGLPGEALGEYQKSAFERAEDESSAPIRWLLRAEIGNPKLQRPGYYVWFYLKETVLHSLYLNWEQDLEESANNTAFKLRHTHNLDAILHSTA